MSKQNPETSLKKFILSRITRNFKQLPKEYTYFSYNANEALHLSEHERTTITECMEKILTELQHPVDKHSKSLIVDNVKLLPDYCIRFYDRQFITRENPNSDILARFETLLDDYFRSGKPATEGLPTVQDCAEKLCLSSNYLSDLLKKETGESALSIYNRRPWMWRKNAYSTQRNPSAKLRTDSDSNIPNISAGVQETDRLHAE